jgi:hypothetical protein
MEAVLAAGGSLPVMDRGGRPAARLARGRHVIRGRLAWKEIPASLAIPGEIALLDVALRGAEVARPELDGGGRLLLAGEAGRADTSGAEEPLVMRVYRRLIDDVPMRLETRIDLSVSGRDREILTGRALPEGAVPVSMDGELPFRLEPDGNLRARLEPGNHSLFLSARFTAPVESVSMQRRDSLWPDEEIWTFEARMDIRVVEPTGAPLIDPSQTGLPDTWKALPAYRMAAGDTLRLVERQRGNPGMQAASLELRREMWLDFAGGGLTRKDAIRGDLPGRMRLEMRPGSDLGRAELGGRPMMITTLEGRDGVEVSAGGLDLLAVSRASLDGGRLEAGGWNLGFRSAAASLHLPPGWMLLHADGPDRVLSSWISRWTLWDVFLLCILTLAMFRLAGWKASLLAFSAFALLLQEPGTSGLYWLNLLAALGLLALLPEGRARRGVRMYAWASFLVVAAAWIPSAVSQARMALYPQLDGPRASAFGYDGSNLLSHGPWMSGGEEEIAKQRVAPVSGMFREEAFGDEVARLAGRRGGTGEGRNQAYAGERSLPEPVLAKVQTGPGQPAWYWNTATLQWTGPVSEGETLRLYLLPPWAGRVLRALQAILPGALLAVVLLTGGLLGGPPSGTAGTPAPVPGTGLKHLLRFPIWRRAAGAACLASLLPLSAPQADAFPSDSLLRQLKTRLERPPECHPSCVQLNSASIAISGDRLRATLVYDAADSAVAVLPKPGEGQLVMEALRIGGHESGVARLGDGSLAAVLPTGRHKVTLEGRLLGARLELAFPSAAPNVAVDAPGFAVGGLAGNRVQGGSLVLRRDAPAAPRPGASGGTGGEDARRALAPDPVPPFVEIRRDLDLSTEWTLSTRIRRVAPAQGAFSLEIPLLPFEHPLLPSMAGDREKTLVSFQDGQDEALWTSSVERQPALVFRAGDLERWSETWTVAATSRWHLESRGLAPSRPSSWRPLPGDSLVVLVTEPRPAKGPVRTVESLELDFTPGRREGNGRMTLRYRAGQGDAAAVTLPPGARLERLASGDRSLPLTQREGTLSIPLQPGLQDIRLEWKQPEGIGFLQRTPAPALGDAAANISVNLHVPGDRWVLWVGGPRSGPALLLWGVLAVLAAVGFALGRTRATPLGSADWLLLFAGTSMVNVYATAPLLALFLLLRLRARLVPGLSRTAHNLLQVGLAALAAIAFGTVIASVPQGLLSAPDMQITGNGSHAASLRWFVDRTGGEVPRGWMISAPLWVYRLAMLAWSLWLAYRLLGWLRWCWDRFSAGGFWREKPLQPNQPIQPNQPLQR